MVQAMITNLSRKVVCVNRLLDIELADGYYGRVDIHDVNPTSRLIIKAQNLFGAKFANIEFQNCSNITLEGVRVDMALEEFYGVEVRDSASITITHSYIYAPDYLEHWKM